MPVSAPSKAFWNMTIDERIVAAGWYRGSQFTWSRLPLEDRENFAFASTGCAFAFPTWDAPVECFHTKCLIRRGKLPRIAYTNNQLHGESRNGWLRFHYNNMRHSEGRRKLARLFVAIRAAARRSGEYDLWKIAPLVVVHFGVSG